MLLLLPCYPTYSWLVTFVTLVPLSCYPIHS
nr:MAG TPA: hypothetical protein [Caudoviricetes sp.]